MPQDSFMEIALQEALLAAQRGEVPVGAVLVKDGKIIAQAGNQTRALNDVTAHAEILVMRQASQLLSKERLPNCDLYVTLEPCALCAAALSFARIHRIYIGSEDPKSGGVFHGPRFFSQPTCHHSPEVYSGFMERECSALLKTFFKQLR